MTAPPNLLGSAFVPPKDLPKPAWQEVLSDEGFRLFYPLAAVHAGAFPILWLLTLGGEGDLPPGLWHMHELIWGSFGAALIGFLTSAFPEWTDTPKLRGRPLWALAGVWGLARVLGLAGVWPALGGLADLAWLGALLAYGLRISLAKRTTALLPFLGWLAALTLAEAIARLHMMQGDAYEAGLVVRAGGLIFLGLLGLALARITVSVSNLMLDPSGASSPFRPHPGRMNLAPGLVALVVAAQALGLSEGVQAWLLLAAGAGFIDRMAEGFIGRPGLRPEVLGLTLSAGLAGAGLIALGIGADPAQGWHLALMGGLGLATLAVMSVSGLLHAGRALAFGRKARGAMGVLLVAVALRVADQPALAAVFWAFAFGLWLWAYAPILSDPQSLGDHLGC